jgi:hypothetical protein
MLKYATPLGPGLDFPLALLILPAVSIVGTWLEGAHLSECPA